MVRKTVDEVLLEITGPCDACGEVRPLRNGGTSAVCGQCLEAAHRKRLEAKAPECPACGGPRKGGGIVIERTTYCWPCGASILIAQSKRSA